MTGISLPSLRNASLTRRSSFARRCSSPVFGRPAAAGGWGGPNRQQSSSATCPRRRRRSTGLRCRGSRLRYRGWEADPTRPGLDHSSCAKAAEFYGLVGIGVKEAEVTFRGGARQSVPFSLGPVLAVRNAVGHRSRRACDIDEKGEPLSRLHGDRGRRFQIRSESTPLCGQRTRLKETEAEDQQRRSINGDNIRFQAGEEETSLSAPGHVPAEWP
jgi:hypothetical protein